MFSSRVENPYDFSEQKPNSLKVTNFLFLRTQNLINYSHVGNSIHFIIVIIYPFLLSSIILYK